MDISTERLFNKDNAKAFTDRLMVRIKNEPVIGGYLKEVFGNVDIKLGRATTSTSAHNFVHSLGSVSRLFRDNGIVVRLKVLASYHEYYDNTLGMYVRLKPNLVMYKVYVDIEHEALIKRLGNGTYQTFSFSFESLKVQIDSLDDSITESDLENMLMDSLVQNGFEHEEVYETHRSSMRSFIKSLSMYA